LKRLAFEVVRQHGSHIRLAKGAMKVTIPNHSSIAPKTLQTALRQTGVTLGEFLDAL
jgi:predicted RNA binding protein YcfA (HicA-like mRNA interferase family)